jgi:hypothetical protein
MMTGAQFEIRIDHTPRTYRDRKDFAMEAASFLKSRNPQRCRSQRPKDWNGDRRRLQARLMSVTEAERNSYESSSDPFSYLVGSDRNLLDQWATLRRGWHRPKIPNGVTKSVASPRARNNDCDRGAYGSSRRRTNGIVDCRSVTGSSQAPLMALTMRRAGLSSGIDQDRADYTVYCGGWDVGRNYETRGGPDNLRWFWSLTVNGPMTRADRVATLEEAKAQFQKSWDAWKAWAKLEEAP